MMGIFKKETDEFCRTEISIEKIIFTLKSKIIEFEKTDGVKLSILSLLFMEFVTKLLKFVIIALLEILNPDDRKYLESLNRIGSDLDDALTS